MSSKINKLPSALTEEELLASLDSPETIQQESPNNVVDFLLFYKIEPGLYPVKSRVLYNLYIKHTKDAVNLPTFLLEIGKYLTNKTPNVYINFNAFQIGSKTFELLNKTSKHVTKIPGSNTHFKNFIKSCDIKDGSIWVTYTSLYQEYQRWFQTITRKLPLGKNNFYKFLKLYFKNHKQDNNSKYIGINKQLYEKDKKEQKLSIKENKRKI